MWNGPSTVDSVAPALFRLLIVSTSMEMPSTSESRMNSCRSESHFWPVAVRKSMARCHSAIVGSVSLTKACRCLTKLLSNSRSRGSAVAAKLSTTALAAVSSVKSVAMTARVSPGPGAGTGRRSVRDAGACRG